MRRQAVLCVVLMIGAGCAGGPGVPALRDLTIAEYQATAADSAQRDINRDGAACELDAEGVRKNYGMGGLSGVFALYESRNKAFDACMRMRGYQRKAS